MEEKYTELIKKYKLNIAYKASTGEEGISVGSELKRDSEDHLFIAAHKNEILTVLRNMKKEEEKAKRLKRDREFEEKYPEAVAESRKTGKAVAYQKGMVPCNDPEEECNFDYVTFYVRVTTDGFEYTIGDRQHTF